MNHNTCEVCGCEFVPSKFNPKQRFCNAKCRAKWEGVNAYTPHKYICEGCGKEYGAKRKNRKRFCSRECYWAYCETKRLESTEQLVICIVRCKWCGDEFIQKHCEVYCSNECRKAEARKYSRELTKGKFEGAIQSRKCKKCGQVFTPEYGTKKRTFCSDVCMQQWQSPTRIRGALNSRARKILRKLYGAVLPIMYEPVNPKKVLERDKWICGICGLPIDPISGKTYGPHCPSVDHIVALANGGAHRYENVQAAHHICNSYKGDGQVDIR